MELREETNKEKLNQVKMIAKLNSQVTRKQLRNKLTTTKSGVLVQGV